MPSKITESTLIPLSLVITLAGGIFWLTVMHSESQANSRALQALEAKQDKYLETVQKIDRRLANIEGRLGVTDAKQ